MAFYVGKGQGKRAHSYRDRNIHWKRIVAKYGHDAVILDHFNDEQDALAHERYLISSFRALGVPLCNLTDGGEGVSGYVPTAETRAKASAVHKGVSHSAEHRAKIGAANKGKIRSTEARAKVSLVHSGKTISTEHRARITAALKGRKLSPEHIAKVVAATTGKKRSAEFCAKNSAAKKGGILSAGHRAKISASLIMYNASRIALRPQND